jgi:hypothetical protein
MAGAPSLCRAVHRTPVDEREVIVEHGEVLVQQFVDKLRTSLDGRARAGRAASNRVALADGTEVGYVVAVPDGRLSVVGLDGEALRFRKVDDEIVAVLPDGRPAPPLPEGAPLVARLADDGSLEAVDEDG